MSGCEASITSHFPGFILRQDRTSSLNCSSCMVPTSLTPSQVAQYGCQANSSLELVVAPLPDFFSHFLRAQWAFPFTLPGMNPAVDMDIFILLILGSPRGWKKETTMGLNGEIYICLTWTSALLDFLIPLPSWKFLLVLSYPESHSLNMAKVGLPFFIHRYTTL